MLQKQQETVYARNCEVKRLDSKQFKEFCEQHHLQGSNNLGIVYYGLFHHDSLVGAMSFGRHHRKKCVLTLDRLCFKSNINVIGGSNVVGITQDGTNANSAIVNITGNSTTTSVIQH